jgi:hypothetical protein
MNKLLSLLLLTPVLALAQELPDEDWICLSTGQNLVKDGSHMKVPGNRNYLFNPSKGLRELKDDDFEITECTPQVLGYVCNNNYARFGAYQALFTVEDSNLTLARNFNDGTTTVEFAECNKL